ncbi:MULTISPECIES: histidinol-phosphatase [Mycobacteriaceae]|uniref:Histidinol-phosphatase n=1 Tax=Mycolicibacterium neoaurum VKM Ac-1815D TaxID=700508 RepID=V5X8N6_MYCNE|nr:MULTISPECIES: histidinol-phosphatase [Mycobacteriaceae]AHC24820.1 histidinol phosphatase [Mycolicibacterium neoaurum VKM Ac-1815D]AMO05366.1 histidinol phosphatase [Mycolicibacterium neoaurum]AXK76320.1 histidinol-phosphatase [Mycolicibacterium neoaurum]KJQ50790.1 histidinol phosphatase [Mycolicibacterium neoaurum]KUM09982.1 histidinol-phosphatase [Mycolicibacterium neoaurum]
MTDVADDLALALQLADQADALTMDRFGALDLAVETKPDLTPVTDADKGAEEALRATLTAARPGDGIFGEEFGGAPVSTGRVWVLDPIDGTKNFVRGVPVWCTLIALISDSVPVVGVISAPALGRRWWAAHGLGAHTSFGGGQRRIQVSGVRELSSASLSYSDLTTGWDDRRERFVALTDEVWRVRAYGDFWSYCLVAEGAVDIACEPEVKVWDIAPLDILIREAGGTFSSLDGAAGPHGGSALATNGHLHEAVRARLSV